jgi:hypothetical protein
MSKITDRWVQTFMDRDDIFQRQQTGKVKASPEKEELMELQVALHLGQLKRDFKLGELNEDLVSNES